MKIAIFSLLGLFFINDSFAFTVCGKVSEVGNDYGGYTELKYDQSVDRAMSLVAPHTVYKKDFSKIRIYDQGVYKQIYSRILEIAPSWKTWTMRSSWDMGGVSVMVCIDGQVKSIDDEGITLTDINQESFRMWNLNNLQE